MKKKNQEQSQKNKKISSPSKKNQRSSDNHEHLSLFQKITNHFSHSNPQTTPPKESPPPKKHKIKDFLGRINIFKRNTEPETYSFKEVTIIMLFSLGIGFASCFAFINIFSKGRNYVTLTSDLEKVVDTYYAIIDNYYGDLDKEELVESAVKGMVSSVGDAYTSYSDSDSTTTFLETVGGTYDGIGCRVAMNEQDEIIVVEVFDDSPSAKGGLQVGDIITKVDGKDYSEKTSTDVANYIKNKKKSNITLTVTREGKEKEIKIKSEQVEVPTVTSKVIDYQDHKVGYIQISIFSSVTSEQFKKQLTKLEKDKIDSLIIDVRNNGGGYLKSVTNISNMLLQKGKIIYQLEDSKDTKIIKDTTKERRDYPIAILINKSSASASEILASVIKESYGGEVIGTTSYGKGTVQQTMNLPDGSMVKYTIQKWLTPKGNWINEKGVEPTIPVELNEEYYNNPSDDTDNQLQEALKALTK